MIDENVLASGAMGFIFGLFAFAAGLLRVRYWASRRRHVPRSSGADAVRYSPREATPSDSGELRAALEQFLVFDRFMDLIAVLFVIVMLLYGAWVAPRLRLVLAVAGATVIGCSLVWHKVAKWLPRR